MLLNIGSGDLLIENALNVDCFCGDHIVDLNKMPWEWEDNSIDGIYMIHFLEHFPHPLEVIKECYRILKPGGFLFIIVPHSSLINAVGCIGHYRTFSYNTFNDYLTKPWYYAEKPMFKTELQRLWYLDFPRDASNPYGIPFRPRKTHQYNVILRLIAKLIQPLIDLSPRVYERFWHGFTGGSHEVCWKGIKL